MPTVIDETPHILVVNSKDNIDVEHLETCGRMTHKVGSVELEDYGCGVGVTLAWEGLDFVVDVDYEPVDVKKLKKGRYELRFEQHSHSPDSYNNGDWNTYLILGPKVTEK